MAGGKLYRYRPSIKKDVKKLKKDVRKLRPEKKHHDTTLDTSFDNDSVLTNLNTIAEGTASGEREGLRIRVGNLHLRYQVTLKNTAAHETTCRLVVVVDKHSQGARPTRAEIFESANANCTTLYNNINEGKRFVILYDKIHNFFDSNNGSTSRAYTFNKVIKVNRVQTFLDGTANTTNLGNNMIYLIAMGDTADASGNEPEMDGHARVYFTDV